MSESQYSSRQIEPECICIQEENFEKNSSIGELHPPPTPEKLQIYIGFFKQCWSGFHDNHKATKPSFNDGPSSGSSRANDGSLLVVF